MRKLLKQNPNKTFAHEEAAAQNPKKRLYMRKLLMQNPKKTFAHEEVAGDREGEGLEIESRRKPEIEEGEEAGGRGGCGRLQRSRQCRF